MPQDLISQFARKYNLPLEVSRVVANSTLRDAIQSSIRYEGMLVYVVSNGQTYVLSGGITNSDWQVFGHSSGTSGTFTTSDAKTVTVTNGIITSIV